MNKQGLIFLTLFSLVLVLGVYYVFMPTNNLKSSKVKTKKVSLETENLDTISAYKEASLVSREDEKKKLEKELTNNQNDSSKKKEAYQKIKNISNIESKEEKIEKTLKDNLKLNCFSKISDNNNLKIVCSSKNNTKDLALDVMEKAQSLMETKYNISVKFTKN